MNNDEVIYICPKCFQVCDSKIECHQHLMIKCNPGGLGDTRRRPIYDLEAVGWVETT